MDVASLPPGLQGLLASHAEALLALGLVLEGETAAVLAGAAAHRGYLRWHTVVAIAAIVTFCIDQSLFWIGRSKGEAVLARYPRLAAPAARVHGWVERHPQACVVGVRFAYGLRTVGPVVIGASGLPAARYAGLTALACTCWALLYATLGWYFGAAAERLLASAGSIQRVLLGLALAAVLAAWLWRRRRRRSAGAGGGGLGRGG